MPNIEVETTETDLVAEVEELLAKRTIKPYAMLTLQQRLDNATVDSRAPDLLRRLVGEVKERDERIYQAEMAQERLQTAVQMALQELRERCSEVAALQWFQHEYCVAVGEVRNADEETVFALRKGLPTLTGETIGESRD